MSDSETPESGGLPVETEAPAGGASKPPSTSGVPHEADIGSNTSAAAGGTSDAANSHEARCDEGEGRSLGEHLHRCPALHAHTLPALVAPKRYGITPSVSFRTSGIQVRRGARMPWSGTDWCCMHATVATCLHGSNHL